MKSPNPNWKPGDKLSSPVNETIQVDPNSIDKREMYKVLIGSVVPRPIAFVSTVNSQGQVNLAPFSFFNAVSSNPPTLVFSVSRKPDGTKKDTLRNIEETKQFVVNSANEWLLEPLVHSAGAFPYGVDEMAKIGLTPQASVKVKPPRVKEAAVQMECELYDLLQIGDGSPGSSSLIIGKIVLFHVYKSAYQNGRIALDVLKPIGRLGGTGYASLGNIYEIPIPEI